MSQLATRGQTSPGVALVIAGSLAVIVSALGFAGIFQAFVVAYLAIAVSFVTLAATSVVDAAARILFFVASAAWFLLACSSLLGLFGIYLPPVAQQLVVVATCAAGVAAVLLVARKQVPRGVGVALLVATIAISLMTLGQYFLWLPLAPSLVLGIIAGIAFVVAGVLLLAGSTRKREVAADAPYNTLAVIAFVLAFIVSIASVVCAHLALRDIDRRGERGRGLAIAALIIGYVNLVGSLIAVVVLLGVGAAGIR